MPSSHLKGQTGKCVLVTPVLKVRDRQILEAYLTEVVSSRVAKRPYPQKARERSEFRRYPRGWRDG